MQSSQQSEIPNQLVYVLSYGVLATTEVPNVKCQACETIRIAIKSSAEKRFRMKK